MSVNLSIGHMSLPSADERHPCFGTWLGGPQRVWPEKIPPKYLLVATENMANHSPFVHSETQHFVCMQVL